MKHIVILLPLLLLLAKVQSIQSLLQLLAMQGDIQGLWTLAVILKTVDAIVA